MSRRHHYSFVHFALRQAFFADPGAMLARLAEPDADWALSRWWESVGSRVREVKPEEVAIDSSGLSILMGTAAEGRLAVIRFPQPEEDTEAHFAAMLESVPSFFTLERATNPLTDEIYTMLCEWTPAGSHLNLGRGPEPDIEVFVETVTGLLEQRI